MKFSYWRGKKGREVDISAETGDKVVPFGVKYRGKESTGLDELKGLCEFCAENEIKQGYEITKDLSDFGILNASQADISIAKIPAPLACYWLGRMEIER